MIQKRATLLTSSGEEFKVIELDSRHIKEYVLAVTSDWYNRYQYNKYKGTPTINRLEGIMYDYTEGRYVIENNENKLVGGIARLGENINGEVEISYFIIPKYTGKGIATVALQKIVTEIISEGKTPILSIMSNNEASKSVAIKCRFKVVGISGNILKYRWYSK